MNVRVTKFLNFEDTFSYLSVFECKHCEERKILYRRYKSILKFLTQKHDLAQKMLCDTTRDIAFVRHIANNVGRRSGISPKALNSLNTTTCDMLSDLHQLSYRSDEVKTQNLHRGNCCDMCQAYSNKISVSSFELASMLLHYDDFHNNCTGRMCNSMRAFNCNENFSKFNKKLKMLKKIIFDSKVILKGTSKKINCLKQILGLLCTTTTWKKQKLFN